MSSVCAVVGGQFGSEGKGAIVAHIAKDYDVHARVGAANAGHTFYTESVACVTTHERRDGSTVYRVPTGHWEKHVMQQIPCAAYANPDAALAIGPGALISHDIFDREMEVLKQWREGRGLTPFPPILVDPRAHVITPDQVCLEAESDLMERIGSTSTTAREGIGQAQADRVMRSADCITARDMYGDDNPADSGLTIGDVPKMLSFAPSVLLEGTQGAGLSLTTGPFPYVTSRNTTIAGLCADVGIAPQRVDRTILVIRTYPIRVADNSGPFFDGSMEIDWGDIGIDPETERTTVTKKIRRVATFSPTQVVEAVHLNGATEIALMFCDYLDINARGVTGMGNSSLRRWSQIHELVDLIEQTTSIPVRYLGTGPHSIIDRGECE